MVPLTHNFLLIDATEEKYYSASSQKSVQNYGSPSAVIFHLYNMLFFLCSDS